MGKMKQFRYVKYKNKSCRCLSGHVHDSRGEAGHCNYLLAQKQGKEIRDYEIQKKFDLSVNGVHICNHYVDFLVVENSGAVHVEEFKGFATDLWRIKRKLFEANYPNIRYEVKK